IVAKGYWDGGGESYSLHVRNNYSLFLDLNNSGNRIIYNPTSKKLTLNNWHHVVATVSSTNIQIYIDGVVAGSGLSGDYSLSSTDKPIYLGRLPGYGYFNGLIEDVAIWDYAFNSNQVEDLFNYQKENYLDENLVAYYKFNDKNASGYILDSATGEYNGRLTNGADTNGVGLWDSNAGYFDGVDDYVRISHSESLEPSEITMSVWIYPTSWSHNSVATSLFSKRSTSYNGFFLFYLTSQGSINWDWCDLGNIQNRWNTGYNPPLNTWTNLVAVRNSTGRYLYVNGNLFNSTVSAGSSSAISSGSDLYIGHDFVSSAYRFKGFMEEAKIYNRALSDFEILQDYNSFLNAKFVDLNIIDAGEVVDWNSLMINSDVNYSFGKEICGAGDLGCSPDKFNDGLVGLWHLNASGLGIDYNDYSLNLNTGSCSTTCPVQTSGLWDTNAVLFSSGKYVDLNKKDSLNASSALTLSTWINLTSANTNNGILFKGALSSSQGVYSLGFFNGSSSKLTARLNGSISEGSGQLTSPNILIPGIWYHVVFVYDGSKMYLYENGLLVASNNYSIPISVTTETLKLGCYYSTGFCFNGSVEDVAMWSRALTATEVSDLYRKGISRLDLNVYSCSDPSCEVKTGAQNISNASNSVWVNLNSSVLNSRYLGIEAYFLKAKGFEDYNAENFWVGSYLKDFNILFYN
ncbi:MAG: LamG domain-containing protein, partial [Bacteroidales bacterium]